MRLLDMAANALLERDNFRLRELALALRDQYPDLRLVPPPESADPLMRSAAAAVIELLAHYHHLTAPAWVEDEVAVQPTPLFVVPAADTLPRLRALCRMESPEPLRRRGMYAPPDFLHLV